ncbi:MAG: FHA domain-containing protein [Planctomycetota bacterium]|jgi:pSer/pThr/pTyr-binding forkhead associated (FHA) protein
MADVCPKCGTEIDPEFAFCGMCGETVERAEAPPGTELAIEVEHDRNRLYEEDVETTLDLRLRNAGSIGLEECVVEAWSSSPSLRVSHELPEPLGPGARLEISLPGFRPPKKVDKLLLAMSVVASPPGAPPAALHGEFRVGVKRTEDTQHINIVKIVGDKNIVDQAQIGAAAAPPAAKREDPPEWEAVRLRRDDEVLHAFVGQGTPLVVREGKEETSFTLGRRPLSFGRRTQGNDIVVRIRGDDRRTVGRISRKHMRFGVKGGSLFLEDISTPGTWVNARRVGKGERTDLREGDVFSLGNIAEYRVSMERGEGRVVRVVLERAR